MGAGATDAAAVMVRNGQSLARAATGRWYPHLASGRAIPSDVLVNRWSGA